jgi:hypothetical protein
MDLAVQSQTVSRMISQTRSMLRCTQKDKADRGMRK